MLLRIKKASELEEGDHLIDASHGAVTARKITKAENKDDSKTRKLTTVYGDQYELPADELMVIAK